MLLSTFAFKFNLRRYIKGAGGAIAILGGGQETDVGTSPKITCNRCSFKAGRCRMTL
jgi:hypothetical protein